MFKLILFFIVCISQLCSARTTIYEDSDFQGNSTDIPVTSNNRQCHNIPIEWDGRASGINSHGVCVELYAEWNCTGNKWIRLYPGNFAHEHLYQWDFNDILKSIKSCEKRIGDNNHLTEGDTVAFYEDSNRKGHLFNMNVDSCKNLPWSWRNRASSLVSYTRCYIFFNDVNCEGNSLMIPANTSYAIDNLDDWDFDKKIISVNNCPSDTSLVNTIFSATKLKRPNKKGDVGTSKNGNPTISRTPENFNTTANNGFTSETVIILSVAVVLFFLFLFTTIGLVFLFIYFRKRTPDNYTPMKEVRREFLYQKYIQYFLKGNPLAFDQITFESADPIYRATNLPYDSETYEIPLECINIDTKRLLGSGEFGIVSKAIVTSSKHPEPLHVAVKTLKPGADPAYIKAILDELKIMMYLQGQQKYNKHPYIVHLIGASTQKIYELQPYIILEFCELGSLDSYLKGQRNDFVNLVKNGHLTKPKIDSTKTSSDLEINTLKLLQWSTNIADGMTFLASNKVIHGDLAARNILLNKNLLAKISDFGLAKRLYQYTQYVKKNQAPLPWRWMAIESIQDMTFSEKSDVWSYGITLWEIFSLAEMPYPGIMYSPEFLAQLIASYRMGIPTYAPTSMYELMAKCWRRNPDDRPTFAEMREYLSTMLNENSIPIYTTLLFPSRDAD